MKLLASPPTTQHRFTAYGEGYVMVNGARHAASVIVLPERIEPWAVAGFEALAEAHFAALAALAPEVVLLGTGSRLRFPHPRLTAPLARAGIGLEVMDVQAACRTFNILAAEERHVAAALLFA
ncbi:MAG TPA: Mth938-like domain-containing protein [Burkholderiales bacterium]